jgi:diadenosine tetraphosphate (Ap4A) HIT family hydrolase
VGLPPLFLLGRNTFVQRRFAVMGEIIREKNLTDYQIMTNGPGYQTVSYLHFHLVAR